MPALAAIPWLIPLISGIAAAGSLGTGIYEADKNSGSGGETAAQKAATAASQTQAQQKAAFLSAQAQNQSGAAPAGLAVGGAPVATTASGSTPAPNDLQAMLKMIGGGSTANLSGGTGGTGGSSPATTPGLQQLNF